ncbi:unnamed protein product [Lathyrus oleraceus]
MSNQELIHDNNFKSSMLMFLQDKEDDENEEQNIVLLSKPTSSTQKHKMEDKDEENDGFKTPTRFENRIQEPKQCPVAPRKSKQSLKRRKPHCKQLLDVSRDVELLFQIKHKTLSHSQQSTKKVRRE